MSTLTKALFCKLILIFVFAISGFVFASECQDGWVTYHGSCYLFVRKHNVSFTEAQHYCQQHGGHLVKVDTAEENLFLKDFLRGMFAETHWMGLTDEMVEGIWKWFPSNTVATYTDWQTGEPNNAGKNENCACFYYGADYRWFDDNCEKKFEPICEIELEDSIVG